jgi:hypothetical protein
MTPILGPVQRTLNYLPGNRLWHQPAVACGE